MKAAELCEYAMCRREWMVRLVIMFHTDLLVHTMHAFCSVLLSDVYHSHSQPLFKTMLY